MVADAKIFGGSVDLLHHDRAMIYRVSWRNIDFRSNLKPQGVQVRWAVSVVMNSTKGSTHTATHNEWIGSRFSSILRIQKPAAAAARCLRVCPLTTWPKAKICRSASSKTFAKA